MTQPKTNYTLYLVTDSANRYPQGGSRTALLRSVEAAVSGGVTLVQYRATESTKLECYETALALRALLRPRSVPLIINDHIDLALAVDADGAHVGQNDLPATVARRLLGPKKIIGLSITHPTQLTQIAPEANIDYLGIGPVFPTTSKDDAAPALGIETFARMTADAVPLPVVAIGGITLQNTPEIFAAGAAGIAVVSALSLASDPAAAARAFRALR